MRDRWRRFIEWIMRTFYRKRADLVNDHVSYETRMKTIKTVKYVEKEN